MTVCFNTPRRLENQPWQNRSLGGITCRSREVSDNKRGTQSQVFCPLLFTGCIHLLSLNHNQSFNLTEHHKSNIQKQETPQKEKTSHTKMKLGFTPKFSKPVEAFL